MPPWQKNYWRSESIRLPKVIALLCAIICTTLSTSALRAASSKEKSVILVHQAGHDALYSRVKAELIIAGFSVHEKHLLAVPAENDVETALRTASAYIFVRELTRTIELYYRTQDRRMFHLEIPFPYNDEEKVVTSLHISEVLRVAFPSETPAQPPPPKEKYRVVPKKQSLSDLVMGHINANAAFLDLTKFPQIGLALGVGIRVHQLLGITLETTFPIRRISFDEPTGKTTIGASALGIAANMIFGNKRFHGLLRLGYSMWFVKASVQPGIAYTGASGTEISSGPTGFVGGTVLINSRIGVEAGGSVSVLTPALHYRMAEKKIATVGVPIIGLSLGILLLPKVVKIPKRERI